MVADAGVEGLGYTYAGTVGGRVTQAAVDTVLQEMLYIPSPKIVKRLSLGYSGLLADVYWTRVVQYFGAKHQAKI